MADHSFYMHENSILELYHHECVEKARDTSMSRFGRYCTHYHRYQSGRHLDKDKYVLDP